MISVVRISPSHFEVTVSDQTTTTHQVTLSGEYYQYLTSGKIPPESLVEKSFKFLLTRESNTSILSTFDLPDINNYFPEYEKTIMAST
jgi:hypothetical protein